MSVCTSWMLIGSLLPFLFAPVVCNPHHRLTVRLSHSRCLSLRSGCWFRSLLLFLFAPVVCYLHHRLSRSRCPSVRPKCWYRSLLPFLFALFMCYPHHRPIVQCPSVRPECWLGVSYLFCLSFLCVIPIIVRLFDVRLYVLNVDWESLTFSVCPCCVLSPSSSDCRLSHSRCLSVRPGCRLGVSYLFYCLLLCVIPIIVRLSSEPFSMSVCTAWMSIGSLLPFLLSPVVCYPHHRPTVVWAILDVCLYGLDVDWESLTFFVCPCCLLSPSSSSSCSSESFSMSVCTSWMLIGSLLPFLVAPVVCYPTLHHHCPTVRLSHSGCLSVRPECWLGVSYLFWLLLLCVIPLSIIIVRLFVRVVLDGRLYGLDVDPEVPGGAMLYMLHQIHLKFMWL